MIDYERGHVLNDAYSLRIPATARRVLASQIRERQQKDELCGPFWVAAIVAALTGRQVSQDEAAIAAGTLLTAGGGLLSDLPPGAASRTDYEQAIRTTPDSSLAGTSPRGIVRAVSALSAGQVTAIPVCGPWTEEGVGRLADLVLDQPDTVAILNVATRYLWNSHASLPDIAGYLDGARPACAPSEWQVGHYVAIVGSLASDYRRVLLCADTYPSLGAGGVHWQAPDGLAAALRRPAEPTSGGVIVAVPAARETEVRAWAADVALEVGYWDNGVPDDGQPGQPAAAESSR